MSDVERVEVDMHKLAVLALHGFVPFDLGIPCEVFGRALSSDGKPIYAVRVCGEDAKVRTSAFDLQAAWNLDDVARSDTVIIPGIEDPHRPISEAVSKAIIAAWTNGARIATICSGSFVLASTGLLNGRRATTHWLATSELARRYPEIDVDPDVLFVDEGRIVTSAGASAGLDMCLHLLRNDHGQAVAAHSARLAVAPLVREGGQAQFIRHEPPGSNANLAPLLEWMLENAHLPLNVNSLAARACITPRTFARRFREQTGTTPLQWLLRKRILLAQQLLETTSSSIVEIGTAVGFEAPVSFRARFNQFVGVSPNAYRSQFNAASARKRSP